MQILVLETQLTTVGSSVVLRSAGHTVEMTDQESNALQIIAGSSPDALVLDAPPELSLAFVRRLRLAGLETPVLVLSSPVKPIEKTATLRAGADDILAKPYNVEELLARVQAIGRRYRQKAQAILRVGQLQLNRDRGEVLAGVIPVPLTGKEYAVLELMVLRRGAVLTKDAMLAHLYGVGDVPEVKIIDVFICKIRKKLAQAGADGFIATVWGQGYMLNEPSSGGGTQLASPRSNSLPVFVNVA